MEWAPYVNDRKDCVLAWRPQDAWWRFPWLQSAFQELEKGDVFIVGFSNGCVLAHQLSFYLGSKVKGIIFASGVPGLRADFGRPCLHNTPFVFVGGAEEQFFGGLPGLKIVADEWQAALVEHSAAHCFEPVSVWPRVLAPFCL